MRARRIYPALFDRVLTRTDPERAHHLASRAIRAAGPTLAPAGRRVRARLPVVHAMGLRFPGVLGLAAGFDKDATGIDGFAALGFSFVEVGTVTGEPQPGNPRPRMFRLAQDHALVNRLGFNNEGAEAVARRLAERSRRLEASGVRAGADPRGVVLGVNIGRTKLVPGSGAVADYQKSARLLAPHADYLVVNVSSPNTPGLRDLQAVDRLQPLLVKIAPDLADEDVLAVADLALAVGLEGIVATNTTIGRAGLASTRVEVEASGTGGLSGSPLTERATEVVRLLRARVGPDLTLIGAGGIMTPEDACARLDAGATLLQTYTGFVYGGPLWPARVQRAAAGRVAGAPESEAVL